MTTIVSKKQAYKVTREEGWYSEAEMANDLGWNQCQPQQNLCLLMIRMVVNGGWHILLISIIYPVHVPCLNIYILGCQSLLRFVKSVFLVPLRSRIDGAKTKCFATADTHTRPPKAHYYSLLE